jgi:hypothetical protein
MAGYDITWWCPFCGAAGNVHAKIRMRQLKSWRKSKRNTRRGWGIEAL